MSVQIQKTPNPNALKFILPKAQFAQPLNFSSVAAAATHPLARQLFALGNIYNIFMVQDFVTVNKLPDAPWAVLETAIQAVLEQYFSDE
ncbi:MAG: NifU N-terminal domain-containing protein [Caldilineaceae bacterium]